MLSVQQSKARPPTLGNQNDTLMRPRVPNSIKCRVIHFVRRELRKADCGIAADVTERAIYAFGIGEWRIEERLTGNTYAIHFSIGRYWFDTFKREFVDLYLPAYRDRLAR